MNWFLYDNGLRHERDKSNFWNIFISYEEDAWTDSSFSLLQIWLIYLPHDE